MEETPIKSRVPLAVELVSKLEPVPNVIKNWLEITLTIAV